MRLTGSGDHAASACESDGGSPSKRSRRNSLQLAASSKSLQLPIKRRSDLKKRSSLKSRFTLTSRKRSGSSRVGALGPLNTTGSSRLRLAANSATTNAAGSDGDFDADSRVSFATPQREQRSIRSRVNSHSHSENEQNNIADSSVRGDRSAMRNSATPQKLNHCAADVASDSKLQLRLKRRKNGGTNGYSTRTLRRLRIPNDDAILKTPVEYYVPQDNERVAEVPEMKKPEKSKPVKQDEVAGN